MPDGNNERNKIHYMENTLSRQPNQKLMKVIKEHNPKLKLGVFSKDEDAKIREYWCKFQKVWISIVHVFLFKWIFEYSKLCSNFT